MNKDVAPGKEVYRLQKVMQNQQNRFYEFRHVHAGVLKLGECFDVTIEAVFRAVEDNMTIAQIGLHCDFDYLFLRKIDDNEEKGLFEMLEFARNICLKKKSQCRLISTSLAVHQILVTKVKQHGFTEVFNRFVAGFNVVTVPKSFEEEENSECASRVLLDSLSLSGSCSTFYSYASLSEVCFYNKFCKQRWLLRSWNVNDMRYLEVKRKQPITEDSVLRSNQSKSGDLSETPIHWLKWSKFQINSPENMKNHSGISAPWIAEIIEPKGFKRGDQVMITLTGNSSHFFAQPFQDVYLGKYVLFSGQFRLRILNFLQGIEMRQPKIGRCTRLANVVTKTSCDQSHVLVSSSDLICEPRKKIRIKVSIKDFNLAARCIREKHPIFIAVNQALHGQLNVFTICLVSQ